MIQAVLLLSHCSLHHLCRTCIFYRGVNQIHAITTLFAVHVVCSIVKYVPKMSEVSNWPQDAQVFEKKGCKKHSYTDKLISPG